MKQIASRDNSLFKKLLKLSQSARERKKLGYTVIEGIHLIQSYYSKYQSADVLIVKESSNTNPEITELLTLLPAEVELCILADHLFNEASTLTTPSGIMAIVPIPQASHFNREADYCIACEDLQDPGNLGAILRSAAAAGIEEVLLSPNCVSAWSPKVLRSAQGAHFLLNIHESSDLTAISQEFVGKIIATSPSAELSLYDLDMKERFMLLIGNEGSGLSSELMQSASHRIYIPMPGKMESLNAAVAASICLFEWVRQTNS
jgi:TrmH family RNA methyltransferase